MKPHAGCFQIEAMLQLLIVDQFHVCVFYYIWRYTMGLRLVQANQNTTKRLQQVASLLLLPRWQERIEQDMALPRDAEYQSRGSPIYWHNSLNCIILFFN